MSIEGRNKYKFTAPEKLSICDNSEETIEYFHEIFEIKHKHNVGTAFFINLENVKNVTMDALMYLTAIVNDARSNRIHKYKFKGNFPKEASAKKIFIESGFLSFVNSGIDKEIIPSNNKIRILKGHKIDSRLAGEICKFVQKECNLNMIDTSPLYEMLIELMGNTIQHAYNQNKINSSAHSWYIYAEATEDYIEFVFLDTGFGIPTTVKKRITEKITETIFPMFNKDSEYIISALQGSYRRTQTGEKYRGKGLPQVLDCFNSGLLYDIFIVSGKGWCKLKYKSEESFEANDFENKISGTLFSWKIKKGR